jgi:hypothetical protein
MPTDQDKGDPAGLFGTLLDRSFDTLITPALMRMLYTLALVCITGAAAVAFWIGWGLTGAGAFWSSLGWLVVVGTPPAWLAALVMARLVVEYLAVQHKMSADLTVIRKALTEESPK